MKLIYKLIVCLSVLLLSSSCITNKNKLYLQKEESKMYETESFEQYRLCVNDEIVYFLLTASSETQYLYNIGDISQAGNNQNSFRIYEDGCVVLPTIGKVKIAGLTLREAEKIITDRFSSIVLDAEVKLALTNNYFYVQGDNGKGQFMVYKENLNIFQALAMAGDISSTGDKSKIKLIRRGVDGKDHVETFDLRKESIVESEYYYIKPNDVLYIPTNSNSFFRIDSFTGFVSLILTPVSFLLMTISFFK